MTRCQSSCGQLKLPFCGHFFFVLVREDRPNTIIPAFNNELFADFYIIGRRYVNGVLCSTIRHQRWEVYLPRPDGKSYSVLYMNK